MKANVIKKDETVVVTLMFFKDSTLFYALKPPVFIKGNSKVWKAAGQE